MESDEKYIESRFGRKNPFKVPDGYSFKVPDGCFDNLAKPAVDMAVPKVSLWQRCRRYVAAACVAVAVAGVAAYAGLAGGVAEGNGLRNVHVAASGSEHHVVSQPQTGVTDAEMDYTMLDNEDIYSLVASN